MIKIAKTVYEPKTIALQNERVVTLVPLPIGRLKKFMKAWKELENLEDEQGVFDVYLTCAGISLSKELAEEFPEPFTKDGELTDEYREYLEEYVDLDTAFEILEVCGGLKLNDPKLLEAAQAAAVEAAGKN